MGSLRLRTWKAGPCHLLVLKARVKSCGSGCARCKLSINTVAEGVDGRKRQLSSVRRSDCAHARGGRRPRARRRATARLRVRRLRVLNVEHRRPAPTHVGRGGRGAVLAPATPVERGVRGGGRGDWGAERRVCSKVVRNKNDKTIKHN